MSRTIQWCDGPTPERQPPASHRMHRERLAGKGDRDAAPAAAPPRCRARCASVCAAISATIGQRVEVVGHLRHPRGVQARGLGPLDVGDQLGHLARHIAALGADHHSERAWFLRFICGSGVPVSARIVADQGVQRCAGREHRGGAGVQQLRHVGVRESCRRRRRRCRRRRPRATPRRCAWSARGAHRTGCERPTTATSSCSAIDTMSSMRCRMPV